MVFVLTSAYKTIVMWFVWFLIVKLYEPKLGFPDVVWQGKILMTDLGTKSLPYKSDAKTYSQAHHFRLSRLPLEKKKVQKLNLGESRMEHSCTSNSWRKAYTHYIYRQSEEKTKKIARSPQKTLGFVCHIKKKMYLCNRKQGSCTANIEILKGITSERPLAQVPF